MKRIAIVGSGQAGLLAAHGLLKQGHTVTMYSDRSADQWLHASRPTGTAARFGIALDFERELGLNHWEHFAPKGLGVYLTFSPKDNNTLVTLSGRLTDSYFQAVDLRLQCHRWMNDFEQAGGKLVIGGIDATQLDAIAQENDLTLVASGRGALADLFPRNAARSVYDRPQRKLTMVIVKGAAMGFDPVSYLPVKFNFLAMHGEAFWVPYYHRDGYACWCLLFEAKEGGPMDQFDDCNTGEAIVARAKKVIKELMPYDEAWSNDIELTDELGWLKGGVAPTVRAPCITLPSGKAVMAIGDTVISMDPIAGQGANLGNKYVKHTLAAIAAHSGECNAEWMTQTFERFWADHGAATVTFNNLFLEPLTPAGKILLLSQYGSTGDSPKSCQQVADIIVENFRDPRRNTQAFLDKRMSRSLIKKVTGKSWLSLFVPGLARAIRNQIRQQFGKAPKHPMAFK